MITRQTFYKMAFIVFRLKDSPAPYLVNHIDRTKMNAREYAEFFLGCVQWIGAKRIAWISTDTLTESAEYNGVIVSIVSDIGSENLPIEKMKGYVRPTPQDFADLEVVSNDQINPLDERWEAGYRLVKMMGYTVAEDFSIADLNEFLTRQSWKWNIKVKQWVIV